MLIASIAELFFWFFWEFLLSFILYTTGAIVLRFISFGRVRKPLFMPSIFSNEKRLAKNDFFLLMSQVSFSILFCWHLLSGLDK